MSVVVIGYIYAERAKSLLPYLAHFTRLHPIYGICTILVTIFGNIEYILKKINNLSKQLWSIDNSCLIQTNKWLNINLKKGGKIENWKIVVTLVLTPFKSVWGKKTILTHLCDKSKIRITCDKLSVSTWHDLATECWL